MPVILPVKGVSPQIPDDCFVAPNVTIVGDVVMGSECSIWFNAVVRGDVNSIRMGNKVNIQDGACLHCTYQKTKVVLGNNVSIGHNAIVHGCTVEDEALVGMGARILNGAVIGSQCIVGAGALVTEGKVFEPRSLIVGSPARAVRTLSDEQVALLRVSAAHYAEKAARYARELRLHG